MRPIIHILLLFSMFLGPWKAVAQYELHPSQWIDAHTVSRHVDEYLSNLLFSDVYYMQWNARSQRFESALPMMLTYAPFADRKVEVNAANMDYRAYALMKHWDRFSPERCDSLLHSGEKHSSTSMRYDEQGKLLSSCFKEKKTGQRIDYDIAYTTAQDGIKMEISIRWARGWFFMNTHQSRIQYELTPEGNLKRAVYAHDANEPYTLDYRWDSLGRLISRHKFSGDSTLDDRHYAYSEEAFDIEKAGADQFVFRIPAIQHWLRESYAEQPLKLISYERFEPNRKGEVTYTYLVDSAHQKLLMVQPYMTYYGQEQDSIGVAKWVCAISSTQNLYDSLPFDPDFASRHIGTIYYEQSIEEEHTTAPGYISAAGAEGYRRTVTPLVNGWKRLSYERGSTAPLRFAPGHDVPLRMDVRYETHYLFDPDGALRYIITPEKICRIRF